MQKVFEFRIDEEFAPILFAEREGKRVGASIRKVEIDDSDPRVAQIGLLQTELRERYGRPFFFGWDVRFRYTEAELSEARFYNLRIDGYFSVSGEECGTKYDDSKECVRCGIGALQVSDLFLDLRKAPKRADIARTLAHEVVVNERLACLMADADLTGLEFGPVHLRDDCDDCRLNFDDVTAGRELLRRAGAAGVSYSSGQFWVWINRSENAELLQEALREDVRSRNQKNEKVLRHIPKWYQLKVTTAEAHVVHPTIVAETPFESRAWPQCTCSAGTLLGLNLLSEVFVDAATVSNRDIFLSREFIGARRGLLRPRRLMFVSRKLGQLLKAKRIAGVTLEVARPIRG